MTYFEWAEGKLRTLFLTPPTIRDLAEYKALIAQRVLEGKEMEHVQLIHSPDPWRGAR